MLPVGRRGAPLLLEALERLADVRPVLEQDDVTVAGAGGHGLASAYYLARDHGMTNVAVLERGYIGGGNTGRNTTIIRSNYLQDPSAAIYDKALKLDPGELTARLTRNVRKEFYYLKRHMNPGAAAAHSGSSAKFAPRGARSPGRRARR